MPEGLGGGLVVEHLPGMNKALASVPILKESEN